MHYHETKLNDTWIEYTLTNDAGMRIQFLNFGGIITQIIAPDKEGKLDNIVLGYRDYHNYEHDPHYFGAIIGRVAGRLENTSLQLDDKVYKVEANEGKYQLHGGSSGLHQVLWDCEPIQSEHFVGVTLFYQSKDGESGFPGNINIEVTYTLTNSNDFIIDYKAISDKQTILTLTNHTYFNLSGRLESTIENHQLKMHAREYIELDNNLLPTGKINDVTGTPFDFRKGKEFAKGFQSLHPQNKIVGQGYDHYFLLDQNPIIVTEETSGRVLTMKTNQPGLVLYTANGLKEDCELKGGISKKHLGFCLETQAPLASLTNSKLPSVILNPNEGYSKQTVFSFHCTN